MTASEKLRAIQEILGVTVDGLFWAASRAALEDAIAEAERPAQGITKGKASSFADRDDVRRFRVCKSKGRSDLACFAVGDNGIGCWGDDTTAMVPMCALPPEDFKHLGRDARGAKVRVRANGKTVVAELRDRMPYKRNITNGAVIDLNPAACAALGLTPPMIVPASWQWDPVTT